MNFAVSYVKNIPFFGARSILQVHNAKKKTLQTNYIVFTHRWDKNHKLKMY